jgi:hypothetical protein
MKETKTFILDFPVFPGNSGGPVYILYSGARISGDAIVMKTKKCFTVSHRESFTY